MTVNLPNAKELINLAVIAGMEILTERGNISGGIEARTIIFTDSKNCTIKIGYIQLGDRIIDVVKTCGCGKSKRWVNINRDCFKTKINL